MALYENRSSDAVESWSRGLAETGGTEADLSWRLAFVLLQLGRVDQAEELIQQFRRLVGNPGGGSSSEINPMARYLEALKSLKLNRPLDCLDELAKARLKIPASLQPQFYLTMGQAYEATREERQAAEEYAESIAADPKFAAPAAGPRPAPGRRPQPRRGDRRAEARPGGRRRRPVPADGPGPPGARPPGRPAPGSPLDRGAGRAPGPRQGGRPRHPVLAILQANALTLDGDVEKAADLLARATAVDRTDPDLWMARAEKLVAMGRLDQALMVLDQAMEPKAAGDVASLRIFRRGSAPCSATARRPARSWSATSTGSRPSRGPSSGWPSASSTPPRGTRRAPRPP